MHRQLRKGLHGRAHRQQHPWGRRSRYARAHSQKEKQPAGQQHGVTALQACFVEGLATGLPEPAHHQQPPRSGPCFGGALTSPGLQHVYPCLQATLYTALRRLCRWRRKPANREMLATLHRGKGAGNDTTVQATLIHAQAAQYEDFGCCGLDSCTYMCWGQLMKCKR